MLKLNYIHSIAVTAEVITNFDNKCEILTHDYISDLKSFVEKHYTEFSIRKKF